MKQATSALQKMGISSVANEADSVILDFEEQHMEVRDLRR